MRTDFSPIRYMNPLLVIGAGLGLLGAGGRFLSGNKQVKESKKINPFWQQYQTNPFAKRQLGVAQQLFQGRMPGASLLEKNIFANQANRMYNVNRLATDSSQALALGGQAQEQTNDALSDLQIKEAQNRLSMLDNLNRAYGTMIGEGDKEYQSMLQKYQMDVERKDALRNAGASNKYGAVSDLASMAFSLAGMNGFGGGDTPNISGSFSPASLIQSSPFGGIQGGLKPKYKIPGIN